MLDVHPPHQPTHTWKDFFIHIATIVVGLLIAVGIEQVVERVHTRYLLKETREALERERESNRVLFAEDQEDWLRTFAEIRADLQTLEFLRQHPNVRQSDLPTELSWTQYPFNIQHAVWDAALANGVTRHMSIDEANANATYYEVMVVAGRQSLEAWNAINDAARYNFLDPDPTHLSPAQLDEEIRLTRIALARHFEQGYTLARAVELYPDLKPRVTYTYLHKLRPAQSDLDPAGMKPAHERLLQLEGESPNSPR